MSKRQLTAFAKLAAAGAFAALVTAAWSPAQELAPRAEDEQHYLTESWAEGTTSDALAQSASGSTVPLSLLTLISSKDQKLYTVTLVGGNPTLGGPLPITIDAVIIPLQILIGKTVFDPLLPNPCDGNVSAVDRFLQSPLAIETQQVFNGVDVGNVQYVNGFMRAEFWEQIKGLPGNFSTTLKWSVGPSFLLSPGSNGITRTKGTACSVQGIIAQPFLSSQVNILIPLLQGLKIISPTKLVVFLLNNVVTSPVSPPTTKQCCAYGLHGAKGTPPQSYSRIDYDTTTWVPSDTSIAAHEIAEWMNDPLGHNFTPKWGNEGQAHGCKGTMEVGDPLTGTNMPVQNLNGYPYHLQELTFFSWFFNGQGAPSLGTGGEFSGHGTFEGPAKPCIPRTPGTGGSF